MGASAAAAGRAHAAPTSPRRLAFCSSTSSSIQWQGPYIVPGVRLSTCLSPSPLSTSHFTSKSSSLSFPTPPLKNSSPIPAPHLASAPSRRSPPPPPARRQPARGYRRFREVARLRPVRRAVAVARRCGVAGEVAGFGGKCGREKVLEFSRNYAVVPCDCEKRVSKFVTQA